jgi:glycosyltransferase involved in cell wall biosynthesis
MKKTKLMIVDPNAYGGHNDFCRGLAMILSGPDSEIIYLNRQPESDGATDYRHIAVGYPDQSYWHKIQSYAAVYQQIKTYAKKGYAIHFQDITPYMIPVVFMLLLLPENEKTFYYTLHNIIPHTEGIKGRVEYRLAYWLLRLKAFRAVFYHFEFIKPDDQIAVEHIPPEVREKMVFVPHHMFHRGIQGRENRLRVDEKDQKIVILFFGAVRQNKGLLEFFSLLNECDVDTDGIKFVVAGEFSEYRVSDLQQIIDRSKYPIDIRIENGFIDDREKERMFESAHFILQPYLDDFLAQSGVVIDAYEYKKPLIVSSNPSLSYLVSHESTGFEYSAKNIKPFLEKSIRDQKQYESYVDHIEKVLIEKYGDDQIRKVYMNRYWEVDA